MSETITTIIAAAYYPISLIIIGVGNGDFGAMETLDGDNGLMDNHGNRCKRDLVQFVPFNRFKNNPMGLASDVLAELPTQLVEYNRLIGKSPNPAQMVDIANMQIQPSVYPGQGINIIIKYDFYLLFFNRTTPTPSIWSAYTRRIAPKPTNK